MSLKQLFSVPLLFAILITCLSANAEEETGQLPEAQNDSLLQERKDYEFESQSELQTEHELEPIVERRLSDGVEIATLDTQYDHCHHNNEHGHKHCYEAGEHDFHSKSPAVTRAYDNDQYAGSPRRSTRYYQTRRQYSGYSERSYYQNNNRSSTLNSIAIGLAIGLPIAASYNYGHRYYGNHRYNKRRSYGYGHSYYGNSYGHGYRNDYRNNRHTNKHRRRRHGGH